MLSIETLKEYGASTGEGLARCMNMEAFYYRMIRLAAADGNFDRLNTALDGGDGKAAFEAAHALKGVLGNLALTPLYRPVSELTELLRGGNAADAAIAPLREEIDVQRKKLEALCAE